MPIVISLAPGERGEAAAHLGAMLARSSGRDLVVAAIVPIPWPPSPYGLDEEFRALQERAAQEALDRVRDTICSDVAAEYVVESARSVSSGIVELANRRAASLVVLGSSARGLSGLVSLGGVAERLLHTLDLPVCFAPNEYGAPPGVEVARITVGFGRADRDSGLLTAAASRAQQWGAALRVVCFAVRPTATLRGTLAPDAEGLVIGQWAEQLRMDIGLAVVASGQDPKLVDTVIAEGGSWREALSSISWAAGDLLAIGASTSAVSRFFLGSHASKIVRSSPVPVLIVARGS